MQIIGDAESAQQSGLSRSIVGSIVKPEGSILKPDGGSATKANYKLHKKEDLESPPHLEMHKMS